ncbi:tRNA (5-methylaminomethyl-2-thiouridylate)-methyltransferase [uncultured Pontibacter sp.]|uniref:tRNA (5-methylaminomethyl-2-thiouridylate)-methyltransferase n=1 Tax=uncultured Pontibacter sp. TaxID=453356 RepID=UPI00262346CC|nr:tRNA (5-methylaminomethyl-2-thiouridylate)-methyltransferase [uncultured Pontibacter sp.]
METFASPTGAHRAERPAYDRIATVTALTKYTYALVPILAGLDKFLHLLTDWNKYLAPVVADILPFSTGTFMSVVGIIEIIAGVLVLIKPKIGAMVVGLWLVGIAINLLLTGEYYDIAVRDLVMAVGAFSLFLLIPEEDKA